MGLRNALLGLPYPLWLLFSCKPLLALVLDRRCPALGLSIDVRIYFRAGFVLSTR